VSDDTKTPDLVQEALDRFQICVQAEAQQRTREIDDLKFQVPELQWPAEVRDQRTAQTVNGIALAARPMLAIPKLDQPIQLVLNQEKAAHLGVQVHPLTEEADDDTAEVLQGLYRAIEVDSRANLARSWAFERAVKAGRGAYRILKEYDDDSDHPSDQKIVIKRIYEQGAVYFDPAANEPDASDAEYAFVVTDVPIARYRRQYQDSALAAYSDEAFVALGNEHEGWITGDGADDIPLARYRREHPKSTLARYSDEEFIALGNERPDWVTGEGDGRAVRVVEYFKVEYQTETVTWEGGTREKQTRVVRWYKLNAVEVLEEQVWDGRYIPLVRTVGRELIPFDGEKRSVGLISQNKDAQRLFNYAASASVEMAALETKASHAVDPQAIEQYETWWQQKNVRNFPYLPYRRFVNGQDLGEPVPIQADMSKMQVNAMLLQQAGEFIHAGTATFEPSLGNQSPNVRTKGATLALQSQSEQANSNWLDNLAEISMTHEARVVLDLIPHVYDRPGRVARILDGEDNPKQVMFNAPFTVHNKRPRPLPPGMPPPPDAKHYDLTKGRYGVTVSVGKAYKSRVEQGKDELGQLFQAEPELFKILGDIYLKFADFPGHREAADRIKKMLPPPLQDQDGQQDAKLQLDQAKAALEHLQQQLQAMAKALETDQVKVDGQITQAKIKASVDLQKTVMDNATKLAVARITAAKASLDAAREDAEEALALNQTQSHEATQNAMDRQHEMNLAEQQHQQVLQQAQQAHEQAVVQAEQGQDHTLQQGDQAAAHARDAAVQQAALQPPADSGAGA